MDPLESAWRAAAERLDVSLPKEALAPERLASDVLHAACHQLLDGLGPGGASVHQRPRAGASVSLSEAASLRLHAHLAGRHGLREALTPAKDHRAFFEMLPADPMLPRHDESCAQAVLGLARADEELRWDVLHEALAESAEIVLGDPEPVGRHPHGRMLSPVPGRTCGTCAWRHETGRGARKSSACRQSEDARVADDWAACERWEHALDCMQCGACCRAAFDVVVVAPRDPVIRRHPELIVRSPKLIQIRRDGDRCAALEGGHADGSFTPFTCRIYDERPNVCRTFERGGETCLAARKRIGLSL